MEDRINHDKRKALNTYVVDVCYKDTFQGLKIAVSDSAMRELIKYGMALDDVVEILENGRDAPRKRKRGKIERWLDKKGKTYNVVVARDVNTALGEECWVLIHFGRFTRK